jgi:hypothetical protein
MAQSFIDIAKQLVADPRTGKGSAIEALVAKALRSPILTREAVQLAAENAIEQARMVQNAAAFRQASTERGAATADNTRGMHAITNDFLQRIQLSDGTPLGDAQRPLLHRDIERGTASAKTIQTRVRFLEAVAAQLPDDKTRVKAVLSAEEAEQLYRDATHGVRRAPAARVRVKGNGAQPAAGTP